MAKLSNDQINGAMADIPEWTLQGASIRRTYSFKDFSGSIDFVNRVAELAEKAWHHPDIDIRWNKVTLVLSTHSEGGLTEKDFALARDSDLIASPPRQEVD